MVCWEIHLFFVSPGTGCSAQARLHPSGYQGRLLTWDDRSFCFLSRWATDGMGSPWMRRGMLYILSSVQTQFMGHYYESVKSKLKAGWWFGTWLLWLSIYWEFHNPNWPIFFRGVETTNQWMENGMVVKTTHFWWLNPNSCWSNPIFCCLVPILVGKVMLSRVKSQFLLVLNLIPP